MSNITKPDNKYLVKDSDSTVINRLETDNEFRAKFKYEIIEAAGTKEAELMLQTLVQSSKGCIEIASALYMEWKIN